MGMSTAFSWTLPPLQFMETFRLGAPDSLHAPSYPAPISPFSWDSSCQPPPTPATHRMWLPMDLPLLCNVYSVLFAKYEYLRGGGCWGGAVAGLIQGPQPGHGGILQQSLVPRELPPLNPPRKPAGTSLCWTLWPQANMKVKPLTRPCRLPGPFFS